MRSTILRKCSSCHQTMNREHFGSDVICQDCRRAPVVLSSPKKISYTTTSWSDSLPKSQNPVARPLSRATTGPSPSKGNPVPPPTPPSGPVARTYQSAESTPIVTPRSVVGVIDGPPEEALTKSPSFPVVRIPTLPDPVKSKNKSAFATSPTNGYRRDSMTDEDNESNSQETRSIEPGKEGVYVSRLGGRSATHYCIITNVELSGSTLKLDFDAYGDGLSPIQDPLQSRIYGSDPALTAGVENHYYAVAEPKRYSGTLTFNAHEIIEWDPDPSISFHFGVGGYDITHVYGVDRTFRGTTVCPMCLVELSAHARIDIPEASLRCQVCSVRSNETQPDSEEGQNRWFFCSNKKDRPRLHPLGGWAVCYKCWLSENAICALNPNRKPKNNSPSWLLMPDGWYTGDYIFYRDAGKSHPANLNSVDEQGRTYLLRSFKTVFWRIRWILRDFPELALQTYRNRKYNGANILHLAILDNNPDLLQMILDVVREKDIETLLTQRATGSYFGPEYGELPLFFTLKMKTAQKLFSLLVQRGADVFARTEENWDTCLHVLARNQNIDDVRPLAELVVNEMRAQYIKTKSSQSTGDFAQDRQIWEKGFLKDTCINRVNRAGLTPLTLAVHLDNVRLFDFLMEVSCRTTISGRLYCMEGFDYLSNAFTTEDLVKSDHDRLGKIFPKETWTMQDQRETVVSVLVRGATKRKILATPLVKQFLDQKWKQLSSKFFVNVVLTAIVVMLFTIAAVVEDTQIGVFWLAVATLTLLKALKELIQLFQIGFLRYFWQCPTAVWLDNTMSAAYLLLAGLAAGLLFFKYTGLGTIALAMAGMCLWLYLLTFFLIWKAMGPLVISVGYMIHHDVSRFLALYLICMGGFSTALFIMTNSEMRMGDALFIMLVATLGQSDESINEKIGNDLPLAALSALMLIWLAFSATVLINMLIAMMNDSYSKILEESETVFRNLRMSFLVELDEGGVPPDTTGEDDSPFPVSTITLFNEAHAKIRFFNMVEEEVDETEEEKDEQLEELKRELKQDFTSVVNESVNELRQDIISTRKELTAIKDSLAELTKLSYLLTMFKPNDDDPNAMAELARAPTAMRNFCMPNSNNAYGQHHNFNNNNNLNVGDKVHTPRDTTVRERRLSLILRSVPSVPQQ